MAPKKIALVISGGGAKGAFAVGVIKYLYEKYGSTGWFAIIGGTSTGALISPMAAMLGHPDANVRADAWSTLKGIYSNVATRDILEKQDWYEFIFRRDCLNESDPLKGLIERKLKPEWFQWLTTPEAPHCYVVYTNFQNGEKVDVSPKDSGMNHNRWIDAMMASASVPVLMEPTWIDGAACFDGGVRDLLPFGRAIALGADAILPIFLEPEQYSYSHNKFDRIDKILLRTLSILVDETGRNDFETAHLINQGLQAKEDVLAAVNNDQATRQKLETIFSKPEYKDLYGPEKRVLKLIEGLRPIDHLTEDSLTFDPVQMRLWIEQGERIAQQVVTTNPFV